MKIDAIGLFVKNMKTMVEFYRDVMDMPTKWDGEANAELDAGDVRLIMYGRQDFEVMTGRSFEYPQGFNGTLELAIDVATYRDVDRTYLNLLEKGVASIMPPATMPWGQRTAYIADPEGNLIEISSFTPNEDDEG